MKIERMIKTINHQEPDRVPRGELLIASELIAKISPEPGLSPFERKKRALNRLTMDFVTTTPRSSAVFRESDGTSRDVWGRKVMPKEGYWVTVEPAIKDLHGVEYYKFPRGDLFELEEIKAWLEQSDFFVFVLLDGIFQGTASLLDFNEFLLATATKQKNLTLLAEAYGDFLYTLASRCFKMGAHGLIVGDDMASNQGPLISPKALEQIFFPVYRRVLRDLKAFQKPIMLHCDGNIDLLLPYLAELGFAGIHSLEPAAGMDLSLVKQKYGGELCLMGNIDPALLERDDLGTLEKAVQEAIQVGAPGGGFILSTASGSLTQGMRLENVLAMYLT